MRSASAWSYGKEKSNKSLSLPQSPARKNGKRRRAGAQRRPFPVWLPVLARSPLSSITEKPVEEAAVWEMISVGGTIFMIIQPTLGLTNIAICLKTVIHEPSRAATFKLHTDTEPIMHLLQWSPRLTGGPGNNIVPEGLSINKIPYVVNVLVAPSNP